jgi:hypothetical protein
LLRLLCHRDGREENREDYRLAHPFLPHLRMIVKTCVSYHIGYWEVGGKPFTAGQAENAEGKGDGAGFGEIIGYGSRSRGN